MGHNSHTFLDLVSDNALFKPHRGFVNTVKGTAGEFVAMGFNSRKERDIII